MIIDNPARLEMGINSDRAHVFHPSLFQFLAHLIRQSIPRRDFPFLMADIKTGPALCETPEVFAEQPFI